MTRELRDFQAEAVASVRREWEAGRSATTVILPTGTGKTDVISKLVTDEAAGGGRALVLAHRGELLDQLTERCGLHAPRIPVGRVQADTNQSRRRIVVAMTQTLAKEQRRNLLPKPTMVVVDECHHITSPSNMEILRWAGCLDDENPTRLLGVTATPGRSDKRGIGMVLQSVAFTRDIVWAINAGWLVKPRGLTVVASHLDLNSAKLSRGDYQDGELGEMVCQDVAEIVRAWQEHAVDAEHPDGRITIAFVPNIASARELRDAFEVAGIKAEAVLGSTPQPEREQVYARLASGVTRVLVGVAVMTEGFDSPPVSCILMARPTRSATVYTQALGRGLRLFPGKSDCLVLDVVGAARGQKLVTLAELHPGSEYDTSATEALPCDLCGQPRRSCDCPREIIEKPANRLVGPARYEEIDLLNQSGLRWLVTKQGIRFLTVPRQGSTPARAWYLWPDTHRPKQVGGTWSVMEANLTGDHAQPAYLDDTVPHTLAQAQRLAEAAALKRCPELAAEQAAPWRSKRATPAQVTWAANLGVKHTDRYTAGRCSDEIDVALATARLAQGIRAAGAA